MTTLIEDINTKKQKKIILLLLLLTNFFGLAILNYYELKYIFVLILLYFLLTGRYKKDKMGICIIAYFIFIIISCLSSYIYNSQNPIKVLAASYPCLGLLFYFTLTKYKISEFEIRNVILKISILFCLCYILQWLVYPAIIFTGAEDKLNIASTYFRMRMPGSICSYILFFFGINDILIHKNKFSVIYILLGFIPIIIMGFRSLVALSVISVFAMIFLVYKNVSKIFLALFTFIVVAGIVVSNVPLVQDKLKDMQKRQETLQTFDNPDYIRYQCYDYFDKYVYKNKLERITGGGYPTYDDNLYNKKHKDALNHSLYWVDLGIVGLSFMIGIPAVLLLVILILLVAYRAKSYDLQYIRFTLLTVLGGSIFTSMELFREGNMLILSLLFYLIHLRHDKTHNICM